MGFSKKVIGFLCAVCMSFTPSSPIMVSNTKQNKARQGAEQTSLITNDASLEL